MHMLKYSTITMYLVITVTVLYTSYRIARLVANESSCILLCIQDPTQCHLTNG